MHCEITLLNISSLLTAFDDLIAAYLISRLGFPLRGPLHRDCLSRRSFCHRLKQHHDVYQSINYIFAVLPDGILSTTAPTLHRKMKEPTMKSYATNV
jgi:hypothetical protein